MNFWRSLLSRNWVRRIFCSRARRRTEQLARVHERVQARFPQTPWVYGGRWSWYLSSPLDESEPVLVLYQYLPLAVLERENGRVRERAQELGIAVYVLGESEERLDQLLTGLQDRAIRLSE